MFHSKQPVARRLKQARMAVSAIFFVNGACFANWLARIPSVREHMGLSDRNLGLVLLATAVGAMLSFRFAGRVIERFGSRRVTAVATCTFCAFLPLPGSAFSIQTLAGALFMLGSASGMMDVAMNSQAVEVERRYGRPILSAFHGVFSAGGMIGALTGSFAAAHGLSPMWHLLAVGLTMMAFTAAVSPKLVVAEDERLGASALAKPSGKLLALGAVAFCSSIGEGAMADWTAVYLRGSLKTSMATAALGYASYSMAMLTGRFVGDKLTTRFGSVRMVRYGGLVVALGLGTGLIVNTVPAMMVGVVCVGAGLSVVVPVVFRAGGRLPGVARGAALATLATLSYSGFLVGPPAIGLVAEHATLRGGLGVVVALAVLLSLLSPAVDTRIPVPDDAPPPQPTLEESDSYVT